MKTRTGLALITLRGARPFGDEAASYAGKSNPLFYASVKPHLLYWYFVFLDPYLQWCSLQQLIIHQKSIGLHKIRYLALCLRPPVKMLGISSLLTRTHCATFIPYYLRFFLLSVFTSYVRT